MCYISPRSNLENFDVFTSPNASRLWCPNPDVGHLHAHHTVESKHARTHANSNAAIRHTARYYGNAFLGSNERNTRCARETPVAAARYHVYHERHSANGNMARHRDDSSYRRPKASGTMAWAYSHLWRHPDLDPFVLQHPVAKILTTSPRIRARAFH
jgi:hypothetical protein